MKWNLIDKKPRSVDWYLVFTQEGHIADSFWDGKSFDPEDPDDPIKWYCKINYPED